MSRRTDEIQREINMTREQLDEVLAALRHKLSPGELIEEAMAYIRTNPGEAGRYVSHTVREHPVSVSMAGLGIGLLAFAVARAYARSDGYSRPDHPAYPHYGSLAEDATTFGQPVGGPAHNEAFGRPEAFDTGGDIYPDVRAYGGRPGYRESRGYRQARRYGEAVTDRTQRGYEAARHGAAQGYQSAREGYRSARHAADDAAHYVQRQARRAGSTAGGYARDEPLIVGAIGLAVGAILGAVLPMTRREHGAIGRESDVFRERMKGAAREGYHRAEHVAEATYDSAKNEATRQGFTGEGARAAAGDVEKRAAAVYNAATDTAKRETERETSSTRPTASASAPTGTSTSPTSAPSATSSTGNGSNRES